MWDKIDIDQDEKNEHLYKLKLPTNLIKTLKQTFETNIKQITNLYEQLVIEKNNIEYVVLSNDYLYFVLECSEDNIEIYDWNVIALPRFVDNHCPIFNVTLPNAHLVYGFAINSYPTNKYSLNQV